MNTYVKTPAMILLIIVSIHLTDETVLKVVLNLDCYQNPICILLLRYFEYCQ